MYIHNRQMVRFTKTTKDIINRDQKKKRTTNPSLQGVKKGKKKKKIPQFK